MSQLELSSKSFSEWVRAWNAGHKRLWLTLSIIWVSVFMVPNIWQYINNVNYCNKIEKRSIFSLGEEGYKRCNVKYSRKNYVNRKNDAYEITSAKYNATPIVWAVIPPIVIPIGLFIAAWIRSGYKKND